MYIHVCGCVHRRLTLSLSLRVCAQQCALQCIQRPRCNSPRRCYISGSEGQIRICAFQFLHILASSSKYSHLRWAFCVFFMQASFFSLNKKSCKARLSCSGMYRTPGRASCYPVRATERKRPWSHLEYLKLRERGVNGFFCLFPPLYLREMERLLLQTPVVMLGLMWACTSVCVSVVDCVWMSVWVHLSVWGWVSKVWIH